MHFISGICHPELLPDPCVVGEKYGDPGDCTAYYQCSGGSNVMDVRHCDPGSKYDYKKKKCRVERPNLKRAIRCQPPCDEVKHNKRNNEHEEKVETVPDLETEKPMSNKRSQNVTDSITEVNEALTTEEDDEKVNAAGSFGKNNDTIAPAIVDPNQGGAPPAASNTTTGGTTEETEAQTENDVITTASTATTSPSTPSPTPKPTPKPTPSSTSPGTKSTTKSTTTTVPGVVIVETDGDPGYDIVTTQPTNSSGSAGELMFCPLKFYLKLYRICLKINIIRGSGKKLDPRIAFIHSISNSP